MTSANPYRDLPDHAFWRRAVAAISPADVDPVIEAPFAIAPGDAGMLAETLQLWSREPHVASEMGAHARRMIETHFSRRHALAHWSELLDRLAATVN